MIIQDYHHFFVIDNKFDTTIRVFTDPDQVSFGKRVDECYTFKGRLDNGNQTVDRNSVVQPVFW